MATHEIAPYMPRDRKHCYEAAICHIQQRTGRRRLAALVHAEHQPFELLTNGCSPSTPTCFHEEPAFLYQKDGRDHRIAAAAVSATSRCSATHARDTATRITGSSPGRPMSTSSIRKAVPERPNRTRSRCPLHHRRPAVRSRSRHIHQPEGAPAICWFPTGIELADTASTLFKADCQKLQSRVLSRDLMQQGQTRSAQVDYRIAA